MRKIPVFVMLLASACSESSSEFAAPLGGDCVSDSDCVPTLVCQLGRCGFATERTYTPPGAEAAANTVADVIAKRSDLSKLNELVGLAGLSSTLAGSAELTVFAPNNAALNVLLAAIGGSGPSASELTDLITFHVVANKVASSGITAPRFEGTVLGASIDLRPYGDSVLVNGQALVTVADIQASNGIVHVIDAVLWEGKASHPYPGTLADIVHNYPVFSSLASAVGSSGALPDALGGTGNLTLFAPHNQAFAAAGTGPVAESTLAYHVWRGQHDASNLGTVKTFATFEGRKLAVSGNTLSNVDSSATIAVSNFFAGNGVLHTLDGVLTPPHTTLLGAISGSGYTSLLQAFELSSLTGSIGGTGQCTTGAPCTLFAPNDGAFDHLVTGLGVASVAFVLDQLDLGEVLQQHLSANYADSLHVGSATGFQGPITLSNAGGVTYVNAIAAIASTDLVCSNGVMHTTSDVIFPADAFSGFPGTLKQFVASYPRFSSFVTGVAGVSGASGFNVASELGGLGSFCTNGTRCSLLVPTKEAFAAIDLGTNVDTIHDVLSVHFLEQSSTTWGPGEYATPLAAVVFNANVSSGTLIDGTTGPSGSVPASVLGGPFRTSNGYVYAIDGVLPLPTP